MDDLEGIIQQDPLFAGFTPAGPLSQNQLAYFEIDGSSLLLPPNHNLIRRIDTFSLEQAYCGCNSPEAYMYCMNEQYYSEINSMNLDVSIRDMYFEKLRGNYLANRNLLRQRKFDDTTSCAPCSAIRLMLSPPSVFPSLFVPNSNNLYSNSDAPSWFNDIMQEGLNGSQFNNETPQEIVETYNQGQVNYCNTQVEKIMTDLASCGLYQRTA
ncbi:hypothetical protein OKW96_16575 [Sphingobacterium sp. KU25419]|nr:hypothetical protein OKW96_16575 [Sphingobacterium sp. KU25419]